MTKIKVVKPSSGNADKTDSNSYLLSELLASINISEKNYKASSVPLKSVDSLLKKPLNKINSSQSELFVAPKSTRLCAKRLSTIFNYIESNIEKKISIHHLASIAAMSPYHFCREFKKLAGKSPYQIVIKCRLRRAIYLLQTSHDSINEIALRTGFSSQSHLSDLIKRDTGMTPRQLKHL
jgi:AraC family transcriptional regulator